MEASAQKENRMAYLAILVLGPSFPRTLSQQRERYCRCIMASVDKVPFKFSKQVSHKASPSVPPKKDSAKMPRNQENAWRLT